MSPASGHDRLHALDAVRAGALLLGVMFHAGFSFIPGMPPGVWAITDRSPSVAIAALLFALHIFRMSLFFFIAGFFAHLMFHRNGAGGFWSDRARRILVPLVAGWVVLAPAIAAVWIWGLRTTFGGTPPAPPADAPAPPPGAFPLTHLWFLYYLLVLYALVVLARSIVVRLDRGGHVRRLTDAAIGGAVRSGAAAGLLALPVALALYSHSGWIAWFGIPTPDHSIIPQPVSLVAFGTAIVFGWLVQRQMDLLQAWRAQWAVHLAGAVVATAICLSIGGVTPVLVPAAPGGRTLAFALCYALAIWCWSFALLGLALRYLSHASARIRYVADASYWIYLAHLPIVVALQVAVGRLPWHWSVKFPLILVVSVSVLLGSYRYLVRSTFIGRVLNGRTYPRTMEREAVADDRQNGTGGHGHAQSGSTADDATLGEMPPNKTTRSASASVETAVCVAALDGVRKQYGKTVALDGLDLDVRRGELLALLGPNGAGKSTAISVWLGLLEPDAGTARLFGRSPLDVDSRRRVGVMMQEVGLTPELRVRELIDLTASYYPSPLPTSDVIARTRLAALAERFYAKLSAGQKRQVQFALAICGRPSLLFLDEPTVGLDVDAREAMWQTIGALLADGCAIVLTTHYLEEAEALADRVAVLAGGRLIASGGVAEIRGIVARKSINCSTRLTAGDVRTWTGVVSAVHEGPRLRITVVGAESVARQLLASDQHLCDLEIVQAGLAAAVTELTRGAAS